VYVGECHRVLDGGHRRLREVVVLIYRNHLALCGAQKTERQICTFRKKLLELQADKRYVKGKELMAGFNAPIDNLSV
jgi:hypothetical protein